MRKICDKKPMIKTSTDVEYAIIDMMAYITKNPGYTLPIRYIWVLSKIVQEQLDRIHVK